MGLLDKAKKIKEEKKKLEEEKQLEEDLERRGEEARVEKEEEERMLEKAREEEKILEEELERRKEKARKRKEEEKRMLEEERVEKGVEEKRLEEELERRKEEARKRKEEERERIAKERLAFLKEEERRAREVEREMIKEKYGGEEKLKEEEKRMLEEESAETRVKEGVEEKRLEEELERRKGEARERKEDERKRIAKERLAFLKEEERRGREVEKEMIKEKYEGEEEIEAVEKKPREDKLPGGGMEKRKEEAVRRREDERIRIEEERLAFLKEEEERAREETEKIMEEKEIERKEMPKKEIKKERKKVSAGRIGIIASPVIAVFKTVGKTIQQILLAINKGISSGIGSITNVIKKILGAVFKVIITIITAFIPTIKWIYAALYRLVSVVWGFIRGLQDKIINTATSKAKHLTPEKITRGIDGMIVYGGVRKTSSQIISSTSIYAVVFSILAGALAYSLDFSGLLIFGSFTAGFVVVFVVVYIILNIMADRRAESVDAMLPDVLQIVSVNMTAGMTPYNSLLVAARPEFGPLAEEIHNAVQDTLGGKPLIASLEEMTTRVRSDKLRRCIKLMAQGMESGGELSSVLQGIATDIRYIQSLQKEMKANTTAYSMFILFSVLIGAPLLLGVSITFVEIFSAIFETIDVGSMEGAAQSSMISLEGLSISPEFFWLYAVLVLLISGFFGGIMIGVIQTGKVSSGITYGPVLAIIAVTIFIVLHKVLVGVFGGAIMSA